MDVRDFFENKTNWILIVLVVCFLFFGILLIVRLRQIKAKEAQAKTPVIVDSNMLYLLDEPLQTPPVQFSRKQRKIWTRKEVEWWLGKEPFTKEELEHLRIKNRETITKLLDSVP